MRTFVNIILEEFTTDKLNFIFFIGAGIIFLSLIAYVIYIKISFKFKKKDELNYEQIKNIPAIMDFDTVFKKLMINKGNRKSKHYLDINDSLNKQIVIFMCFDSELDTLEEIDEVEIYDFCSFYDLLKEKMKYSVKNIDQIPTYKYANYLLLYGYAKEIYEKIKKEDETGYDLEYFLEIANNCLLEEYPFARNEDDYIKIIKDESGKYSDDEKSIIVYRLFNYPKFKLDNNF